MRLIVVRFFNYFLRLLFLSQDNRPQLKVRILLITALVIVAIIKVLCQISQMIYTAVEYDLMWDALQTQNVSNYKIMCDTRRINDSFARNQQFLADYYLSLGMDHVRRANNNKKMYSNIVYDLNLTSYSSDSAVSALKFCTLNVKKHFYSKTYQAEYGSFLYKRVLDEENFRVLEINGPIFGGFYQPPYCIQEYLRHSSADKSVTPDDKKLVANALERLRMRVKQYDYDYTINRNPNVLAWKVSQIVNTIPNLDANIQGFIASQNKLTIIIIPFLRREANLKDLLLNLHSFLQRQYIQYRIVVAEQHNSNEKFNKGRLYNAAFQFIHEMFDLTSSTHTDSAFYPKSRSNYEELRTNDRLVRLQAACIVMHDVDLIPESDLNVYKCQDSPRHLSLSIRRYGKQRVVNEYERSPYDLLIGGVLVIKPSVYRRINGFSNEYWNWGAEDDDLAMRMLAKNVCVRRPLFSFGTYAMASHKPSTINPDRNTLLFSSVKRMPNDGLNNLKSLGVRIVDVEYYALFTHLSIHVGKQGEL